MKQKKKFNLVVIFSRFARYRQSQRIVYQKGDPENQPEGRSLSDSAGQGDQTQGNPLCQKPATRRGPPARRPLPRGFWFTIKSE